MFARMVFITNKAHLNACMPSIICVSTPHDRTRLLDVISQMTKYRHKSHFLDFKNTDMLHPNGAIYFLHHLDKYSSIKLKGRSSSNTTVKAMLSKLNVHARLGLPLYNKTHPMIDNWHIFKGDKAEFNEGYLPVEKKLKECLGETELFFKLNEAISEAVINAVSHGYEHGAKYKTWILFLAVLKDTCHVVISDLGVTIPYSIPFTLQNKIRRPLTFWNNKGDADRIEEATIWRKTATNKSYRGKGFDNILSVCEEQKDARITVLSRYGGWSSQNQKQTYHEPINGTIITWSVPFASLTKQVELST